MIDMSEYGRKLLDSRRGGVRRIPGMSVACAPVIERLDQFIHEVRHVFGHPGLHYPLFGIGIRELHVGQFGPADGGAEDFGDLVIGVIPCAEDISDGNTPEIKLGKMPGGYIRYIFSRHDRYPRISPEGGTGDPGLFDDPGLHEQVLHEVTRPEDFDIRPAEGAELLLEIMQPLHDAGLFGQMRPDAAQGDYIFYSCIFYCGDQSIRHLVLMFSEVIRPVFWRNHGKYPISPFECVGQERNIFQVASDG